MLQTLKAQELVKKGYPSNTQGKVLNAATGEIIPFALIQINTTTQGTVANHLGQFELKILDTTALQEITVSSVGYRPSTVSILSKNLEIKMVPDIQYLQQVVVSSQRIAPKEIIKMLIQQYQEQLKGRPYQLDAYYYSTWVVEHLKDTAINEAVYTLLYDNFYDTKKYPKGAVTQKRRVNDKVSLIPWPAHGFIAADLRPEIGLLNDKVFKATLVDSITAIGDEVSIYYHVENPKRKQVGWSPISGYRGILVYDENEMRLISHQKLLEFEETGRQRGFLKASYFVKYDQFEGLNLPMFSQLNYESYIDGEMVSGSDITKVNEVKLSGFDFPDKPVGKIKEAPYNPEFWKNYNRIK